MNLIHTIRFILFITRCEYVLALTLAEKQNYIINKAIFIMIKVEFFVAPQRMKCLVLNI